MVRIIEEDIHSFIDEMTPDISDQGESGWCLALAVSNMNTVVVKKVNKDVDPGLVLSPQVLIDAGASTPEDISYICCDLGLESITTYPYVEVERNVENWDYSYYTIRKHKKYCIDNIDYYEEKEQIIDELVHNFRDGGKKFPIVGAMHMGDFGKPTYARNSKNLPYHGPTMKKDARDKKKQKQSKGKNKGKGKFEKKTQREEEEHKTEDDDRYDHAVLIVGMDTMSPDPLKYYCKVKNTYGTGWGRKGFSEVGLGVFNYILVPRINVEVVDMPSMSDETFDPCVPIYVSLPAGTIDRLFDPESLLKQLEELKSTNVDGVRVDCWWGIVERDAPMVYDWEGYKILFQMVHRLGLKLQVVMCFHGSGENAPDDIGIPLPQWVVKIGEKNKDIFFTDSSGSCYLECLSWGVDNERVLGDRTPLEVYFDFMRGFRHEFAEYFVAGAISMIEIGLGPCGELRYPSNRVEHGWIYSGIGEYQCYDKYMRRSLKNVAEIQGYSFCGQPEMGGTEFFRDEGGYDSFKGRFFNNWYSQFLINHGDRVLSLAQLAFQGSFITIKLPGIHWLYHTNSHAAELTAGFFNTSVFDGYEEILEMLNRREVGLNFTLAPSSISDPDIAQLGNPDRLTSQVLNQAFKLGIPITGGNHLLCLDHFLKKTKHLKNEHGGHKMPYSSITYRELGSLLNS